MGGETGGRGVNFEPAPWKPPNSTAHAGASQVLRSAAASWGALPARLGGRRQRRLQGATDLGIVGKA